MVLVSCLFLLSEEHLSSFALGLSRPKMSALLARLARFFPRYFAHDPLLLECFSFSAPGWLPSGCVLCLISSGVLTNSVQCTMMSGRMNKESNDEEEIKVSENLPVFYLCSHSSPFDWYLDVQIFSCLWFLKTLAHFSLQPQQEPRAKINESILIRT